MTFLTRSPGTVTALAAVAVLVVGGFAGLPLGVTLLVSFALIVLGATMVNGTYVLHRLIVVIPTVVIVTAFTFWLQNSRGDKRDLAFILLGPGATDAGVAAIVEEFHLDEPMYTRYGLWLSDALRGDLGRSPISNQQVSDVISSAVPVSLQLMLYAQIVALLIAIPLGVYAAYRANKRGDRVASSVALTWLSIPNFVLAVVMILFFALGGLSVFGTKVGFEWLPGLTYVPFGESPVEHFKHMALPTLALALGLAATYMRVLRSDMISTLQENFITTARAKGVPNRRILWGHALRPSSFTLITVFGLSTGTLIGGSLIIEGIFNLPGFGTLTGTAIFQKDFLTLQGVVVVIAVGFILFNFLVDLLYAVLDPRIRNVRVDVIEAQVETGTVPGAVAHAEEGSYRKRRLGVFFWASVVWLVVLVLAAVVADMLPLKDPEATFRGVSRDGPNSTHWFGADNIGHDIFSRTIYGARRSLAVATAATLLGGTVGVVIGLVSGFYRRAIDVSLMAFVNILLAIPGLVLLITLVQFLAPPGVASPSEQTFWATIGLSILVVPTIARIARAQIMVWGDRDFVMASRTLGARNKRIIVREIFPNIIPTLVSFAFTVVAVLIVAEAALALLGVGDVSGVSWGLMIQNGRSELERSPHMVLFPALFIFLTVLAINFIGDQVRTLFDVREKRHLMAGSGTAHLREDTDDKVLQVEHMVVEFPSARGTVHAVSDVSLDLLDRETLGIVGESGCGKLTTGKAIMRVPPPTSGRVLLDGVDMSSLGTEDMRRVRGNLQMIFQDAISSLNPRRSIRQVVAEPMTIRWLETFKRSPVILAWEAYTPRMLKIWRKPIFRQLAVPILATFFVGLIVWVVATALGTEGLDGVRDGGGGAVVGQVLMIVAVIAAIPLAILFAVTGLVWLALVILMPFSAIPRSLKIRRARAAFEAETEIKVRQVLEDVGIDPAAALDRRPHEFSGGQAQRISIARALILDPEVIICDEPVSALDVSVQAQVLNLLEDLKVKYGISLIFIAHDLAVVKNISDRVVVMYLGKVCEVGAPDDLFLRPLHPYTEILMSSIPITDPSVDPRAALTVQGELPSPVAPPSGCRFRTRCPKAADVCSQEEPVVRSMGGGQFVACHFPVEHASPNGSHVAAAAVGS